MIASGFYCGEPAEIVELLDDGWCRARVREGGDRPSKRQRKANEKLWRMWPAQIMKEPWGVEAVAV